MPKNQEEMIAFFKKNQSNANLYKKFAICEARKAVDGEVINTVINGILETTNRAKATDVIIKGTRDELYVMDIHKFKSRYEVTKELNNNFQSYLPTGKCIAFKYQGEHQEFIAPWGELMIVEKGDYLATISEDVPEVYRIEKQAFKETYAKDKTS